MDLKTGGDVGQRADAPDREPERADSRACRATATIRTTLLDKRDVAINELSKYLQVTTLAADDGSLSVFMNGGQRLVLGAESATLAAVPDAYDPSKVQLGITEAGQTRAFPAGFVTGGSVAGLLRFQNSDLPDARNLLGQMAAAISGRLNQQQALGLDLGQPPGSGAPLLSVGSPGVSPASTNAQAGGVAVASYINGSGVRVPSVSLTIVDSEPCARTDYELRADPADPAGTYRLTRLSDGVTQSVVSGAVVDGFRIDVATPLPALADASCCSRSPRRFRTSGAFSTTRPALPPHRP
jgi:flagellar hook-associated protein 1 FlgK